MTPAVAEDGVAVRSRPGGSVAACTTSARGACAATGLQDAASASATRTTRATVRRMRRALRLSLEEVHGAAQPFVEVHQRRVVHQALGLADVGQRVRYVARAARRVAARQRAPQQLLQPPDDVEEAHALAAADVEGFTRRRR